MRSTHIASSECGRLGRPWIYTGKKAGWVGDSTHLTRGVLAIGKTLGHSWPGQLASYSIQSRCSINTFNKTNLELLARGPRATGECPERAVCIGRRGCQGHEYVA